MSSAEQWIPYRYAESLDDPISPPCPLVRGRVPVMRLLDQVVRAPAQTTARNRLGAECTLTAVGAKADAIAACKLRYILDDNVAAQCRDLVLTNSGLLDPKNKLLRMPGELFWMEWPAETADSSGRRSRMAVLVEASPCGRRGVLTSFAENSSRLADMNVVGFEFDLDNLLIPPPEYRHMAQLRHGDFPHLDELFRHAVLTMDPTWLPFFQSRGREGFERAFREIGESVWFDLPMALAFAVMLATDDVFDERPTDFSRLNNARRKRGLDLALDHVEVRLKLGGHYASKGVPQKHSSLAARTPARLHYVRGHVVTRRGTTFWRAPHLRGDHHTPMISKTVRVSSR